MAKQVYEWMKDFFSRHGSGKKVKWGINGIDEVLGDIEKGNVIVVVGRPTDSREELLHTLVINLAAEQKIPTLILNLSSSEHGFYHNLLSNITGVSIDELKEDGLLDKGKILEHTEMYVDFPTDRSMDYIENTIREHVSKGVEVVFIDLFQSIEYRADIHHSREDICLRYSRQLYMLAKELDINMIIGSTVNDWAYDREGYEGYRPQLQDLSHISRLDEYSDLVLGTFVPYAHQILCDEHGYDLRDVLDIFILKNNINQKTGKIRLLQDISHRNPLIIKELNRREIAKLKAKSKSFNDLVNKFGLVPADGD